MIEQLSALDEKLFLWLNQYHSPFMDDLMVFISGKYEWIPLYVILLFLVYRKYKKATLWVLLGAILTVALADQLSVQLFKEVFQRYRPCHNLNFGEIVHTVNGKCGGQYGFVSSHATNAFAIASFLGLLLSHQSKNYPLILLLLWASIVAYSRIYLGVHYPADIIVGGLLGCIIGVLIYKLVLLVMKKIPLR